MQNQSHLSNPTAAARFAGALYLVIIVLGVWSELAVRSTLILPGNPTGTAARILENVSLFRASFAADSVMAIADAALAVILFMLLRPVSYLLALMTLVFRLIQTAIIGMNLLNQHNALQILQSGDTMNSFNIGQVNALADFSIKAHSSGYDLGLIFFGVNSLLVGFMLIRSGYFPRVIGVLMLGAGLVYLTGSYLHFLAPGLAEKFVAAYAVTLIAETSFCLWLLIRGVNSEKFRLAEFASAAGPSVKIERAPPHA